MNYQQLQDNLFNKLEEEFKTNPKVAEIVNPVLDYKKDNRICLTSVSFVDKNI